MEWKVYFIYQSIEDYQIVQSFFVDRFVDIVSKRTAALLVFKFGYIWKQACYV